MKARIEATIKTTTVTTIEAMIETTPETTIYLHLMTPLNYNI